MLKISADEVARWRTEIDNAEAFRDKHFGQYHDSVRTGAGENIEYFERGDIASGTVDEGITERPYHATMNMIYTIAKNIVPNLYYKNPKILAFPKRKSDEDSAPFAADLLNYYFTELNIKETNQLAILDAYLLGMGVTKIGYSTQFGMDIPDEGETKRREKSKIAKIMEGMGLKKPKVEEPKEEIELEENVVAENPYVVWVSPFDFLIDPRATSINNAQWVCHTLRKTLDEVKKNPNFKNTKDLKGQEPEDGLSKGIPQTEIDKFKTIDLYEVHCKTPKGIYLLILAKDGDDYKHVYYDKSIYEMDGYQFEIVTFNKHGHKLYPKSDVDIIKPLQDRLVVAFDSILDQVDKFQTKIIANESKITEAGKRALTDGQLGSVVYVNDTVDNAVKELSLTQVKADMMALINQLVDIISLESGLTRAQLTGMTSAETATEAQIGQAGSNVRLSARADDVQEFSNRQARKLWQVVRQFVDLEEVQLITGESAVDEQGIPRFKWFNDQEIDSEKLSKAELRFQIEVGSTQKPDVAVVRRQFENFINMIARPEAIALLQQQGTMLDLAEIIRIYLKWYPEMILDVGRILKPVGKGALDPNQMQAQLGQPTPGGGQGMPGQMDALMRGATPSPTSEQQAIGGEAGQL